MTIRLDTSRAPMAPVPNRLAQNAGLRGNDQRTHIERINDWVGSPSAVRVPDPQPEHVDVAIMMSDEQFAEVLALLKPISEAAQMVLDAKEERDAELADAEKGIEDLVKPPAPPTVTVPETPTPTVSQAAPPAPDITAPAPVPAPAPVSPPPAG